jgi:hypothetical protein
VYEAAYGALKDFQPLIAALTALAAAVTVYISARRIVATQSVTARESLERQLTQSVTALESLERQLNDKTKKEEADIQRRTAAIKFFINFRLLHLRTTLNEKLSFAERLLTYNDLHEGGISRRNQKYGFVISVIEHVPLLSESEWKLGIGWGDLALLDQTTQYAIHIVTTSIILIDSSINEMKITLQDDLPLMKFTVDRLIELLKDALQKVEATMKVIDESLPRRESR